MVFGDYRISTSDPWIGHKSTQYYAYWEARRRAVEKGFDEAILLNERGEIAEGAMANIFWIRADALYTPHIDCGGLPGIFSAYIKGLRLELGIELHESAASPEELAHADSIFLTNSLGEVMVAQSIGQGRIFDKPLSNPVLSRLIEKVEQGRPGRTESSPTSRD
jgi:branched-subunit amino acid aminotransferase/4-amino-4-deoxychorismate lyase